MRYAETIDIALPRDTVVALFADPGLWPRWQASFVRAETIEGETNQAGAKTKLVHRIGRSEMEMLETIEANDLPDALTCIYEAGKVWNRVINRFTETQPGVTQWEMDCEFRCGGLMRFMALLMPGMFKKETRKNMSAFKAFAEAHAAGDDGDSGV